MSATAGDIAFSRLGDAMAIAVEGLDLHRTPDDELAKSLRQALLDNLVLCIRGQSIGPCEYLATIATFGEPLVRPEIPHVPGYPAVTTLSSDDRDTKGDGKRLIAGSHWHSDDTFMAEPCSLTCLYGIEIPGTGGDTEFANMYAAYEALPTSERRHLDTLRVVHMMKPASRAVGRTRTIAPELLAARPPVVHPLVRTHPETGRKALYISRNRMDHIVDMDLAAGHQLIDELVAHATQPQFCYRHKWRQGDIVIWDDRCTMHKANGDYPEGARRFMNRIIVAGDAPY
jgi:alpha-ketoglutarate-dependent taurine dioxygenase